jgi:hypothetical protein
VGVLYGKTKIDIPQDIARKIRINFQQGGAFVFILMYLVIEVGLANGREQILSLNLAHG